MVLNTEKANGLLLQVICMLDSGKTLKLMVGENMFGVMETLIKVNGLPVLNMEKEFKSLLSLETGILVSLLKGKLMGLEGTSLRMELFIVEDLWMDIKREKVECR